MIINGGEYMVKVKKTKTNSKKRNKSYSTKISKSRKKYPKKKKTYSKTHQQASNSSKYKKDPMQKFY